MSERFDAADVVAWAGARLRSGPGSAVFDSVSIDSRTLRPGALFVAIRGEQHDGHAFAAAAAGRGASGLLVERGVPLPDGLPEGLAVLEVADPDSALTALAAGHRARFAGPVVAITGSNGKTTSKEMCAAVLAARAPCLHTPGNWNNQYGVPLTLLLREASHRSLVVEIGMNHRGEIAPLAALARPTVGLVTNVGTAHIENLGSIDAIAEEKGDLVAGLAPDAVAVLNADDPRVMAQAGRTRARVLRFGLGAEAEFRARDVRVDDDGAFRFRLETPDGATGVRVRGLGETTVVNALGAATAALAAGAALEDLVTGLAALPPIAGRMERLWLEPGVVVLNDSYNANPQSMEAALRSLARAGGLQRRVAVLGDMAELGPASEAAHREAGRLVAALGIDYLFVLGRHAEQTAAGALEGGLPHARVHVSKDHREIGESLDRMLLRGDGVLVKGSRSARMELVVEAIAGRGARA